jgi:hypothetical protein
MKKSLQQLTQHVRIYNMTYGPLPAIPDLAQRLAAILAGLVAIIARLYLRHPRQGLIVPLYHRLTAAARRFTRLADRVHAGRPARRPRDGKGRKGGRKPHVRLPHARAWLLKDLKHEAALYTLRLEALLAEPAMATLLAAAPQAARILRPLCHMLGANPAALPPLPPRQPRKPRARKPRAPKQLPRHRIPRLWLPGNLRPLGAPPPTSPELRKRR